MAAPLPVVSHKLVLLGDTAVGKSCLVVRFCRGEFYDYQEPTIVRTRGEMAAQGEEWRTAHPRDGRGATQSKVLTTQPLPPASLGRRVFDANRAAERRNRAV